MVGATATPLNRNTSRTCRRDPADPRRRSTHTRVSRPASTAPNSSSTDKLASTSADADTRPPAQRRPSRQDDERRQTDHERQCGQRQRDALAQHDIAQAAGEGGPRFRNDIAGRWKFEAGPSCRNVHFVCHRGLVAIDYMRPRTTGISRSRIFLRRVLRLRPSIDAALIWLPRVAARVKRISGRSTSAMTRS